VSNGTTKQEPTSHRHEEDAPENRSEAERDHDRILYTSALQRLAGITQIASVETGFTIHNRLTHTLKVAQVARRLSKRLGLDADGQETAAAAALAHDLGHPPFGHLAEKALNEQAKDWGGFEGNAQSFRIVTFLALRSDDYRGLNLTQRTLNAILKYPWLRDLDDKKRSKKWGAYFSEQEDFDFARVLSTDEKRSIEAQIMDWSDDVTYAVHDLEDFFRIGLIPLEPLSDSNGRERKNLWASLFVDDKQSELNERLTGRFEPDELAAALDTIFSGAFYGVEPYRGSQEDRINLRYSTSYLIGEFIQAVSLNGDTFDIDRAIKAQVAVLKELAWFYVINDPSLATIQRGQRCIVEELHEIYCDAVCDRYKWQLFPLGLRELIPLFPEQHDRLRLATDFVASLTEQMAYELHHRLTGVSSGSILDAPARASR
jgi:dGTPase